MGFNAQEWIDEQLKDVEVTEAQKKVLVETLGDEAVGKRIEASTLRQQDYGRKMDKLAAETKTAQEAAEELRLKAETKYGELAAWEKTKDAEAKKLQDQLDQAQQKAARAEAALKKTAEETGLDLKDLGIDLGADVKPAGDRQEIDTEKFVTKDQLKNLNAQMGEFITSYAPELIQMAANHQVEFKKPLDIKAVVEEARKPVNAKKGIQQVYEEMHDVSKHRTEVAEAAVQKRIEDAKQEGVEEGIRQATAPPDSRSPDEIRSPALRIVAKEQKDRGTPGLNPVERAVQKTLANRAKAKANAA